jgi:hypothetical protein
VAYDDWDAEFQDVWDDVPGIPYFREYEQNIAEELFERGFTHHAGEEGYDRDDARAAREEFFEFTGLPEELFPWDEWRDAMGYD